MTPFTSFLVVYAALLLSSKRADGFVSSPRKVAAAGAGQASRVSSEITPLFYKHLGDDDGSAEMLPLSTADIARLTDMRSRQQTIPIMILDSVLPDQRVEFGSDDERFGKLLEYIFTEGSNNDAPHEMGMIGLNPHTGRPLNLGVTLKVEKENIKFDPATKMVTISAKGGRRFEVQGEPRMDETESFHLADVEIVESREESMSEADERTASRLAEQIPELFESWLMWVLKSGKGTRDEMEKRMRDLGKMPKEIGKRAMWVAALVNSAPSLEVSVEVRPAMLACHDDYQRTNLAVIALQSSIDHLSGKTKLF